MALRVDQIARLEDAYRAGATLVAAAKSADVCETTVQRQFKRLAAAGIQRPAVKRKQRRYEWPVPKYTGPDWIGKPR